MKTHTQQRIKDWQVEWPVGSRGWSHNGESVIQVTVVEHSKNGVRVQPDAWPNDSFPEDDYSFLVEPGGNLHTTQLEATQAWLKSVEKHGSIARFEDQVRAAENALATFRARVDEAVGFIADPDHVPPPVLPTVPPP